MLEYMSAKDYCEQTGFEKTHMEKLLHCSLAPEFSYQRGKSRTSPYYVIVPIFEKMMVRGDFWEVLKG